MESKQVRTSESTEFLSTGELPIWMQAGITILVFTAGIILYYAM